MSEVGIMPRRTLLVLALLISLGLQVSAPVGPVAAGSSGSNSATAFSTTQTTYVYYNSTTCTSGTWTGYTAVAITSIADTWVRSSTHDQLQSATYNAGNIGHQCNANVNVESTGQQTIHPVYSGNQASFSRTLNYHYSVLNAGDGSAIGHWMKGTVYQDQYHEYGYPCSWVYLAGPFISCP